nr:MAG TPA: hypothetical protein [Bacteriophage sp.]
MTRLYILYHRGTLISRAIIQVYIKSYLTIHRALHFNELPFCLYNLI